MSLVFLDTETTGLDPFIHDVWEVAWAFEEGEIYSAILPHSLATADPKALDVNGYWGRRPLGGWPSRDGIDPDLRGTLDGATIVGANPAFDAMFLQHRWRAQPWHYRLIDVSSMAVQEFGFRGDGLPPGMFDVANECRRFGEVPEPDHTAAGDVATLRACYRILEARRAGRAVGKAVPSGPAWVGEPACTCPITDPAEWSTAYTVAHFGDEPHAADCPRRGIRKAAF